MKHFNWLSMFACILFMFVLALCPAQSTSSPPASTPITTIIQNLIQPTPAQNVQTSGSSSSPTLNVPTWSFNYAYSISKPHNAIAIISNTLKSKTDLFGVKPLSALLIGFAGTQLQTSGSTASQGLTGGFGGELAYQLGGNLFGSIGVGYAYSAGQQGHVYWLIGGTLKF